MKPLLHLLALCAIGPATAAPPARIAIPPTSLWCVASQPIEIGADAGGKRFGDLVFQQLFLRLQDKAVSAELPSIGVPFLESVSSVPAAAPPASAQNAYAPVSKVILRVCAVVPPNLTGSPAGVDRVQRAAADVLATGCEAGNAKVCEARLTDHLKTREGLSDDQVRAVQWKTSQALSPDPAPAAISASLTDYALRPLDPKVKQPEAPRDWIVIWAPIPK